MTRLPRPQGVIFGFPSICQMCKMPLHLTGGTPIDAQRRAVGGFPNDSEVFMPNAQTMTELYVTTNNEPGALARCTVSLRENNINIEAVCAYEKDPTTAAFHFVTTDSTKAREWLTKNGYTVSENDVVCWNATNTPGALNQATSALAEKKINISYLYGSGGPGNPNTWVVFNTNNNTETLNTLNNL